MAMSHERKNVYKLYIENGVKRKELAVINMKHYGPIVPSPVSRDGDFCWRFEYIQPVVEKKDEDDWFMNMIMRDLDRSFAN